VGATVIQNSDAGVYKRWLENALERVLDYPKEEQIVFVNAWNEWAEGCHLEPDLKNGKKFLEATRTALEKYLRDNHF
jgi:lipopolysaccharide biosynthesis protein